MSNRKRTFITLLTTLLILLATAGTAKQRTTGGPPPSGGLDGVSQRGIVPAEYPGNFASSDDDQVCYDLAGLTLIGQVTSEMRGFRVDPTSSSYGEVTIEVSPDGKSLDWSSSETVLAFVVKGGPNFHVYDYVGTGFDWDGKLISPPVKKGGTPQISHYNVCYQISGSGEGCTPGYWRNHGDRWTGVSPGDDFDATFGVDIFSPDITLAQAIWLGGGSYNALARHATAALLNSYGGVPNGDGSTVSYPYSTDEVIAMVQNAVTLGTVDATKDALAAANELGCPLSGTRANPV